MAPGKPPEAASGYHPRNRPDYGYRDRRNCFRRGAIYLWSTVRGLDRTCSEAAFERGTRARGRPEQAWGRLFAPPARAWRAGCNTMAAPRECAPPTVARFP